MKSKSSATAAGRIYTAYVLTMGVLLLASFVPAGRLWGFNWFGYFSWYGSLALAVLGAAVGILLSRRKEAASVQSSESTGPFWIAAALLTTAFTLAYILLSARLHFLGDGYQLLASLQAGVNHKPWETGTFLIQKSVNSILGGQSEDVAELALQITSWASGLVFIVVSAVVGTRLFTDNTRRVLYFLGVATGGYALLFFGYLESYPLFILCVGCLFQVGLLVARDKLSRWFILPLGALAAICHIFFVALLPGLGYLIFRGTAIGKRFASSKRQAKIGMVSVIVIAGAAVFQYYYLHSYFFRFTIVPLFSDRFTVEGYTLFSAKHLLDYLNHLFQLFPGLLVVLVALWPILKRKFWRRPAGIFTLLTLLPSLGLVFIFNPGLGFPRDWDLFSFVGIPLVCGFYLVLLDEEEKIAAGSKAAALAVALGCLLLAPRVVSQVLPEKAIAVFDSYSNLDPIRNGAARFILLNYLEKNGRLAEKSERERQNAFLSRHELWDKEGQALYREGKFSQAEARFRRAIAFAPCFAYSWMNIGVCFTKRQQWDSALVYFQIADALNPFNADNCNSVGWAYFNLNRLDKAEEYYLKAVRLRPDNPKARANLAHLYRQQNRTDEFAKLLVGIVDLPDVSQDAYFESADQLLTLGEIEAARRVCRRAVAAGADSSMIRQFEAEHPGFLWDTDTR